MSIRSLLAALALCLVAAPAWAQERDYCPARPGLGTPACTIAPGRVSLETGLLDWQREDASGERQDTIVLGDTLVRIGVADNVELQAGWTPWGRTRTRDTTTGATASADGIGDALLGLKVNLANPDGGGLSFAVQPYVTLPIGGGAMGAGDWGGGIVAPVSYDLSDALNIQFSPEIDAAPDGDGSGRHFAYSGTVGLGVSLTSSLGGTVEFQAARDEDPAGHSTQLLGALSFGWMAADNLQFDVGGSVGLNRDAPDVELYFGFSRLF